jgi:hypothetical protein
MRIRCRGKVFSEPFPSSGRPFLLIKNLLPSNECYCIVRSEIATQQRLYTLQYILTIKEAPLNNRWKKKRVIVAAVIHTGPAAGDAILRETAHI